MHAPGNKPDVAGSDYCDAHVNTLDSNLGAGSPNIRLRASISLRKYCTLLSIPDPTYGQRRSHFDIQSIWQTSGRRWFCNIRIWDRR